MTKPGKSGARPLISIIVPARNEGQNVPALEKELLAVVDPLPYDFEFIVIDNASTDRTGELVKEICSRDPRWRYIRFSRNFLVDMSITAGYHFAEGDAIIVLYSDLQDPPDMIPRFLEKWEEGYDVVYGVQTARSGDPVWRNLAARLAYRLISRLSDVAIPRNAGDFRLISRPVRDALERVVEYNRYMRGIIAWLGFRQVGVPYVRRPRLAGRTKAPFWPTLVFTINALTSFSMRPLRLFLFLGMLFLMIAVCGAFAYSALWLYGSPPPGITTIIVLLLAAIGILGEYVGRTYAEVKRRPLYVVHEAVNIEHPDLFLESARRASTADSG